MSGLRIDVGSEAEMVQLGIAKAKHLAPGQLLFLYGELGAGKTTLVRGLLRGLGHRGSVKSPTYTLLEPYELATLVFYHLDLFRLRDAGELEAIGIRDYLDGGGVCVVEWPERGRGVLPSPDAQAQIDYDKQRRVVTFRCFSRLGRALCEGP